MTHGPSTLEFLLRGLAGYLYIVLGVWVLTLTPRRTRTTLLGVVALSYGLYDAPGSTLILLDQIGFFGFAHWTLRATFNTLAAVSTFALAWAVPNRLDDYRLLAVSAVVGLAFSASWATAGFVWGPSGATAGAMFVSELATGLIVGAMVLWALRASPSRGHGPGAVTQMGILTVALSIPLAYFGGLTIPASAAALKTGAWAELLRWSIQTLAALLVAGLWGVNMLRARDATVRIHRAVMLSLLGLLTAGTLWGDFPGEGLAPLNMLARTLSVTLLAYGILRHDLAGLDAKVEWGVSKTTVAGVFVAVFFIVSEGAQVLLADVAGSELLGILAAGALLFALAPIQRAADRFAAKAVPGGAEHGYGSESSYRRAVRLALADGEITRGEERELAGLADDLGITAARALDLREDVEVEVGGADD